MGVVLKRTKSWYSWFSTAECPVVHHCHLHCYDLSMTGVGLSSTPFKLFLFLLSFLLNFRLLTESSSDIFLFLSWYVCLLSCALSFQTWLIVPYSLVCHISWLFLLETSCWQYSHWQPSKVMQTVLQCC